MVLTRVGRTASRLVLVVILGMVSVRMFCEASEGGILFTAALLSSSCPAVRFGVDMASGGALWVALRRGFLRNGAVLIVGSTVVVLSPVGVVASFGAAVLDGDLGGESTRAAVT